MVEERGIEMIEIGIGTGGEDGERKMGKIKHKETGEGPHGAMLEEWTGIQIATVTEIAMETEGATMIEATETAETVVALVTEEEIVMETEEEIAMETATDMVVTEIAMVTEVALVIVIVLVEVEIVMVTGIAMVTEIVMETETDKTDLEMTEDMEDAHLAQGSVVIQIGGMVLAVMTEDLLGMTDMALLMETEQRSVPDSTFNLDQNQKKRRLLLPLVDSQKVMLHQLSQSSGLLSP